MKVLSGKAAFKGVAIGKIREFGEKKVEISKTSVSDVEAEVARFEAAKETASAQLGALYEKAVAEVGEENAAIFEVHQMMTNQNPGELSAGFPNCCFQNCSLHSL